MRTADVHYQVLPNGLTLLLRETHLAPVASLQFWARVGSADERPGEEGLAHFHEHMLFKGTERRGVGEIAGEIEGAGGHINAYTTFDTTVYYATVPTEALSTGVDVLCDALRFSRFDPDEVKRESEVVIEEIRRSDDSPAHVLSDAVFRTAYSVHPYRAPILGPAENVAGFDRDKVTAFFRRWYTPDNLVVVATGDFDAASLAREVAGAFEGAEPGSARRNRPAEPGQDALRSFVLRRPFECAKLDLSWQGAAFGADDGVDLDLLAFILGECESSRLVREVKEEEGLADRIDASSYTPLDAGLFSVNVDATADRMEAVVAASLREVERLRQAPVRSDELERARANFLASEHFERESVSGMAGKLGNFHVLGGGYENEAPYFERVRKATPEDLLRAARHYLAPERLTAGVLLPEDGDALEATDIEGAVARGLERGRRIFAVPRRLPLIGDAGSHGEVHSYQLECGARVLVAPRRNVPVVAVRAAFLGGLLAEDASTSGLTSFLGSMWTRGTHSRSAADFARSVEDLASEIEAFSGRNSLGLTLEVTSENLEAALDLWAEALLTPAISDDEVERERRDTLAAIDRRADRLAQRAFLLFGRTLFQQHPYRLSLLGERESVLGFDVKQISAHHARLVQGRGAVIGVAGDVDPDAVASALSTRLAELKPGEADAPGPAAQPEPRPSAASQVVEHAERQQAHLVLGFQGVTVDDPDRHALEVITQILAGQGGRLFLELRDRQSLAYSVSAVNVEGVDPGLFALYIASAPDKVEVARTGLLRELEQLVTAEVAAAELERARRHLIGSHAIDSQRASSHASYLAFDVLYGLEADEHLHYADRIRQVSAEDVLRVARRILTLDTVTEALIHPDS